MHYALLCHPVHGKEGERERERFICHMTYDKIHVGTYSVSNGRLPVRLVLFSDTVRAHSAAAVDNSSIQ